MEWAFEVIDKLTGPMSSMDSKLGAFERSLKATEKELAKFERQARLEELGKEKDPLKQKIGYLQLFRDDLQHQKSAAQEAGGALSEVLGPLAQIGTFAFEAAGKVRELAEAAVELGLEFIKTGLEESDFREDTQAALETLLGTSDAADKAYDSIVDLSRGTKATRASMVDLYKDLSSFDLAPKAVEDIIAAASDVGAIQGEGAKSALLETIKHVQATGKFDERMLHGLRGIGAASPEKLTKILATQHHTTEAAIKQMLQSGQIKADEGVSAILSLVQENIDKGGPLGSMVEKLDAGDWDTTVKNIKENFHALFGGVDTKPFLDVLAKFAGLLDPASESGKRLADVINRLFGDLGAAVSRLTSGDLENTFDVLVDGAESLVETIEVVAHVLNEDLGPSVKFAEVVFGGMFRSMADGKGPSQGTIDIIDILADTLGFMIDTTVGTIGVLVMIASVCTDTSSAFIDLYSAILDVADAFGEALLDGRILRGLVGLEEQAVDVATHFIAGLVEGIDKGALSVLDRVKSLGGDMIGTIRSVLGIHSPSAVMMELGEYTGLGFSMGFENAPRPDVDAIMPSVGSLSLGGAGPGGGNNISVDLDVHVHTSGGAPTPDVVREIAQAVRVEVVRVFEGLALEN